MKNNDVKFLNKLYQNANMGVSSLSNLIPRADDVRFKRELKDQLDIYQDMCDDVRDKLYSYNVKPKDLGFMAKTGAEISMKMSTMMDNSPSHMAQMMIEGTNMGIIDLNKDLNNYCVKNKSILNTARDMLECEQQNIDRLKPYL